MSRSLEGRLLVAKRRRAPMHFEGATSSRTITATMQDAVYWESVDRRGRRYSRWTSLDAWDAWVRREKARLVP